MTKYLFHIILLVGWSFFGYGQQETDNSWKKEADGIYYGKDNKYKGPDDWYTNSPSALQQDFLDEYYLEDLDDGLLDKDVDLSEEEILAEREHRYGSDYNEVGKEKGELLRRDPLEMPDLELPDVDLPEIDAPDIDLPDVSAPDFLTSGNFWRLLLFLLLFALVIAGLYYYLKNRKPKDVKIVQNVENDWNPEIVPKSELQKRLDKAHETENYRECVRIYFTFILKELSNKGYIKWRSEKTNYHYLNEMRGKPDFSGFNETVRIYEVVWYGDYHITETVYRELKPAIETYYQSLNPSNE